MDIIQRNQAKLHCFWSRGKGKAKYRQYNQGKATDSYKKLAKFKMADLGRTEIELLNLIIVYACDTSNPTNFGMLSSFLMLKSNLGNIHMRKIQNTAVKS